MPDHFRRAAIRALRTFLQTFLGVFLVGLSGDSVAQFADIGLWESATAAGLVAVLSYAQNALEALTSASYDRG